MSSLKETPTSVHAVHYQNDVLTLSNGQEVSRGCIIGIQTLKEADVKYFKLLYVSVAEESPEAKIEQRTTFKALILDEPPAGMLLDFSPMSSAFWAPFSLHGGVTRRTQEHTYQILASARVVPAVDGPTHAVTAETTPARQSTYAQTQETSPNVHVIISIGSGSRLAKTCFENLVQPFLHEMGLQEGVNYTTHTTASTESIIDFTKSVLLPRSKRDISQSVILMSGDGGVVDVVNGLAAFCNPSKSPPTNREGRPASGNSDLTSPRIRNTNSRPTNSSGDRKPLLAIIPVGTGNALASSSNINSDRTLGLSSIFRGRPLPLPIFKVSMSPDTVMLDGESHPVYNSSHFPTSEPGEDITVYGAVVFSYGFHATLVSDSDTPEYRKHGATRFQMAANDLLFPPDGSQPHAYPARVSVLRCGKSEVESEWRDIPRSTHAYVLATFVSHLEAGFTISPSSTPLDGKLRLIHFGPMEKGGDDLMDIMKAAYAGGKHIEDERVGYEEVEGVSVELDGVGEDEEGKWRRVCIDGKIFEVGKVARVRMVREETSCLELVVLGK